MAQVFRASWVLPIVRPPIRDGWVAIDRGRILDVGGPGEMSPVSTARHASMPDPAELPFPCVAILPGLVNAHTHLELSWMHGQVPPAQAMPRWAKRLMALRRTVGSEPEAPIHDAIAAARATGTVLVGDITNTFAAYAALADSQLSAAIFRELLGFSVPDPQRLVADVQAQIEALTPLAWLRPSIVPHAPYSVSPDLLRAIAAAADGRPVSIHVAESFEEIEFLRDGSGFWRELLAELGVWNETWRAPGVGPIEYLERAGLVNERLLAVHGVQLTDGELARLARVGATVVTCPRSNAWTGAGDPPVGRFYASGVRVAVGTDSLASVADLNMFTELAAVRRLAPAVPPARILESATMCGAAALGFGSELGTIEPGKRADLLAVRVPPDAADVEEYLVGGVPAADVTWLPQ